MFLPSFVTLHFYAFTILPSAIAKRNLVVFLIICGNNTARDSADVCMQ